jgi:hypothetical protein
MAFGFAQSILRLMNTTNIESANISNSPSYVGGDKNCQATKDDESDHLHVKSIHGAPTDFIAAMLSQKICMSEWNLISHASPLY